MTPEAAEALVDEAAARLWSPEGSDALSYLAGRGLTDETIRAARLGFAPRVQATTRDGRPYTASGIVLPWFVGDNLALVKVRQPEGRKPKYAEVYRDWDRPPTIYPSPATIRPGRPLVVVEGEFDCLLLDQALGERAAVVTLGSAMRQARGRHCLTPDERRALVRRPGRRHGRGPEMRKRGKSTVGRVESGPPRVRRIGPSYICKDGTRSDITGCRCWGGSGRRGMTWQPSDGDRP